MTLTLLCLAAFALVAWSLSAATGAALRLAEAPIARLAVQGQARIYFVAALLPLGGAVAILVAALAPSFGWIADHCATVGDPHSHPHLCAAHHQGVWPQTALLVAALLLPLRVGATVLRQAAALFLGVRARRALDRAAVGSDTFEDAGPAEVVQVLPFEEPRAFLLGLLRPQLYVTRGLVSGRHRAHLPSVLAHERAHRARRDPLRRFVARLALSFHVPGIAGAVDRRLLRAQEMAADDSAAVRVGSRRNVADALVALARAGLDTPRGAFSFGGSDVEARVLRLLDPARADDLPSARMLAAGAAGFLCTVAAGADGIHHGLEILLGLFGSWPL